ncbi:SRPBCC family protein [Ramlibacter sp. USB13]|uniref:SRPBCC family protein n=1 Tax=Ramlibacter cellulosilyticus TaxID=2764187 RepID=A0A923SEJ2_9BURK|nr:SRPBCC family protein [Ramlibacter cellulosilyticus]MBC5786343.1 SRPBCC family protein [Ramlibacter cellulosilyticus]
MLKTVALVAVLAIGGVLLYAATRPDTFRVARSTTVKAPPAKLHALINDLHQFNTWNPFEKGDPQARGEYRGPAAGPGAAYHFAGGKSGSGSLRILESAPTHVRMELHMLQPMEALNNVQFTLQPQGDATEVTWSMDGATPFLGKVLHVFIDMDRMVGSQFESGLADLKQRAERT